ncbi:phytanoyl-CoA dioxygenase family protein [Ciceribacter sp. L1K22]|uniref:phytanoyl-CoA dioxygenase family protein n=1 Tax=Ciceribacter sp. L1K22 TaxID=2820275 RepID=UPI001ABDC21F|nr:phytanoyl-CoA dioxygenase family protein [Ciceribacter sp. L1K22]MBO3760251.1 phytanoyl-CoA dioxygenase family protein [Ciceribacter sp. L1K22]
MLSKIKAWASMPWYAMQVLTGQKAFKGNPILTSERLNRRGLHVWRVRTAHRLAAYRRRKLEHLVAAEDREAFDRNGYIERRDLLPPDRFRQVMKEVESLRMPAREMYEGNAVTRRTPLTPDVLANMPALRALLDSAEWKNRISYVGSFRNEPVLSIQTIFSDASPREKGKDPQTNLHMDTFHPTVKAWYFLHDIVEEEGPFTYVPGSHKLTRRRLAWQKRKSILASRKADGGSFRLQATDLKYLRLPQPTVFSVPANTLVVGDTFGFHARGPSSRPSVRIEIYATQRPNPFIPFVNLDSAVLPFVRGRKQVIPWYFEDLLLKLGIGRRRWYPVGAPAPGEPVPQAEG